MGGGIVGAGALLDAASRGLKVALVEQDDIAAGTSSRSSRLIHGGLRYLQQGQVGLVREALAERARLVRLAPHLVRMEAFLFPIYGPRLVKRAFYEIGLTAYDLLGSTASAGRHRHLGLDETLAYAPNLVRPNLRGALLYHDAMEDDARFALAVVRTAIANGQGAAVAVTRVRALRPLRDGIRVAGAVVSDLLTGATAEVRTSAVLDATGVWARSRIVRSGADDLLARRLRLAPVLRDRGEAVAPRVAEIAGQFLCWDDERQAAEGCPGTWRVPAASSRFGRPPDDGHPPNGPRNWVSPRSRLARMLRLRGRRACSFWIARSTLGLLRHNSTRGPGQEAAKAGGDRHVADKTLTCSDCNMEFEFSEREQAFYAEKGFTEPRRCPSCRASRKAARSGGDSGYGGSSSYSSGGGYDSGYGGGGGYSAGGYSSGGGGGYGQRSSGPREMFSATCSSCGKEAKVPFRPTNGKPVYCSDCFRAQRGG